MAAVITVLSVAGAGAAAVLERAIVTVGGSPLILPNSQAAFEFTVSNPDPREARVTLVLTTVGSSQTQVVETRLNLAPESRMQDRIQVPTAQANTFQAELYQQGQRLRQEEVLVKYRSRFDALVMLLNERAETEGLSDFSREDTTFRRISIGRLDTESAFSGWEAYADVHLILVGHPAYEHFTGPQYRALRQYVEHGGTLVFYSPEGILAAAETPLRDLLPVTPVGMRNVEHLPELSAWARTYYETTRPASGNAVPDIKEADGIPFLESFPVGSGSTTLHHNEYPLIRWRQAGLGRVGCVAVNPFSALMRDESTTLPLLNHILSWSDSVPESVTPQTSTALRHIISQLTGFRIPEVQFVRNILVSYWITLLVLLALGFAFRKHFAAWGLAAICAVVLTVGIFFVALRQVSDQPEQLANTLSVTAHARDGQTSEHVLTLFSRKDVRPTVHVPEGRQLFAPMPPPFTLTRSSSKVSRSTLRSVHTSTASRLPRLSVKALQPRSVVTQSGQTGPRLPSLPTLRFTEKGDVLEKWDLPPAIAAQEDKGYLVNYAGIQPLVIEGGACYTRSTKELDAVQLNTLYRQCEAFLRARKLARPHLFFIREHDKRLWNLHIENHPFVHSGYDFAMVPVQQIAAAGRTLTLERDVLQIHDFSRMGGLTGFEGKWKSQLQQSNPSVHILTVQLPPPAADLKVREITVDCHFTNPGANVAFEIGLAPSQIGRRHANVARAWNTIRSPAQTRGTVRSFTGIGNTSIVNPVTGTFSLLIRSTEEEPVTDPTERERVNRWKVSSLDVRVTGTLPEGSTEMRRL